MLTIYHKPHSARRSEASFVQLLRGQFPEAIYRAENFPLPAESLKNPVHTAQLLAALETDALLPARQRTQCIELLRICPPELAVALNPNRISFDLVVVAATESYYWEYHEEQHRRLTVTRPKQLYDARTHAPIPVPRFLQRLVRDIWRVQSFQPYTIVWKDWFGVHQYTYQPMLQAGLHEFALPGKFSFRSFYQVYLSSDSQD